MPGAAGVATPTPSRPPKRSTYRLYVSEHSQEPHARLQYVTTAHVCRSQRFISEGSIPGQAMSRLWTKCNRDGFFSSTSASPLSISYFVENRRNINKGGHNAVHATCVLTVNGCLKDFLNKLRL